MSRKRYCIVGTGIRAFNFMTPMVSLYRDHCELVGLCDLNPARMAHYNDVLQRQHAHPAVPTYRPDQFEQMLKEQRPDSVIIVSKDSTHHEFIVKAVRAGCEVVTEKPMTIDAEKCRHVLDTVDETRGRVRVAFNYRWSAHRTRVRELLAVGTIGQVRSVNLEYLLNTAHGADYYHRWHATMAESGGLLVHKSTHHFDLVNWWLDAIPEEVVAYGQLDYYGRANAIARGDETLTRYDRYTNEPAAAKDPFAYDLASDPQGASLYLQAEGHDGYIRDRNVFRDGIDIYDNMSVLVRYRTGVLLNYSLVSFSPREGMRVTCNGDRGRLEYCEWAATDLRAEDGSRGAGAPAGSEFDAAHERVLIYPHFRPSYEVQVTRYPGGHDGGDPKLTEQIFSPTAPTDPYGRHAGHEQGAASILVGIAANQSIANGHHPVRISDLVRLKPEATRLSELV